MQLTESLNHIIEKSITDFTGYAFQLYATFVASSQELKKNYQLLFESIMSQESNWGKDMKYLIPALSTYVTTVICKHPEYASKFSVNIQQIVVQLMDPKIRMEQAALKMSSVFFEKIGVTDDGQFLHQLLMTIFQSLHFYRNNTKRKVIPAVIMKHVHAFFATFMVCFNSQTLVEACNKI